MKKIIAILLAVVLTLSLCACGPKEGAAEFTMTVGHSQPEGNPRTTSMDKFAADVEAATEGRVKVSIMGAGQLGNEKEMLEQVVGGQIQGMRGGQYDFSPRLLMFTLPFLANDRAEVTALLNSDLAKKIGMEAEADTGTVIINMCDAGGFRQFSNNEKVIKTPSDLEGLKMRSNGMKTIDLTLKALGATVVTVPYNELYMGLKTGLADGQENPWVNVEGMNFHEAQKYFTEVNYQFHPDPFYVNADWWNALPADLQTIVMDCATDMGTYNDELIDEVQQASRDAIEAYGCEIYVPTAEELELFKEAVKVTYQQCIEEGILTQAELDELLEIVEKA